MYKVEYSTVYYYLNYSWHANLHNSEATILRSPTPKQDILSQQVEVYFDSCHDCSVIVG